MLRRKPSERGEGNLGCVLWTVCLLVGVLIAWKAIPVKVASAELYDHLDELARFAAARDNEETLKKKILTRAAELELPVAKENVTVKKENDRIRMTVSYVVFLEFPGYTYEWNIEHELDRPIFIV